MAPVAAPTAGSCCRRGGWGCVSRAGCRHNGGVADPSWRDSLLVLRELITVPAAQANATTLVGAHSRWQHHVVARASMHDLLFTMPGQVFPFPSMVKVTWAYGTSTVARWQDNQLVEQTETGAEHLDAVLDAALTGLVAPVLVCRSCGHQVLVGAGQFEVFEQMHYLCFHYQFEHGAVDVDEECGAGGCPSAHLPGPRGHGRAYGQRW